MTSYAVGILDNVRMGPPIVEYLQQIDATLKPHGGCFIVHGGDPTVLEGSNPGTFIVIEFPDRSSAEAWYGSRHRRPRLTSPTTRTPPGRARPLDDAR